MKKQLKALALTLALITTTACGNNNAAVEEPKVAKEQPVATTQTKVTTTTAPKGETKEAKKPANTLLIPQTVELKDKAKQETVAVAEETIQAPVFEESNQIEAQVKEEVKEVVVADKKEETKQAPAKKANKQVAKIDSVTRTSESTRLPNTVENTVAANEVAEEVVETVEENLVAKTYAAEETKAVQGGLTVTSPTAAEVKAYWTNYQSEATNKKDFYGIQLVNQEAIHSITPDANLNQLNLGQVSKAAQLDALHIANTARVASGLNEMNLGANQAAYAQAATILNRVNLAVSHNPAMPAGLDSNVYASGAHGAANSNLAASFGLLDSVVEYLKDDLGTENQLEAGHRRWILNPSATATGFGQTEEFNAMYVNNNDYNGQNANQVVAYPGQTAISEFHSGASSLSIQFGENFDITNATVEVTDLKTGEIRTDSHIDQSFKGNGRAITFGNGMNYAPGTKLAVKVNGVTKNGQAYPVEYTINYCSII